MARMKIVLRVRVPDDRKKAKALKTISTFSGVNSVAVDTMDQTYHRITVVGEGIDTVAIVHKLRKLLFRTDIISVEEVKDKKDEEKKKKDEEKKEALPDQGRRMNPIVKEFTLENLNHMTNNFSEDRKIGRSRYGAIYKGVQDNGKCIAVMKLLHLKLMLKEEFKNEISELTWVQHPNTVQLVGYCHHTAQVSVEHKGEYVSARVAEGALCFEYLEGPTLDEHLSNEPCGLHWHTCYMIIMGICKGLQYLHSLHYGPQRPTIYHLDLKPANILMDRYMMPKIEGFGLPRIFASLTTNNIAEETSVYLPPEYINRYEISPKYDVFNLGVIIIQIMAGKESYSKCADISPDEFIQLVHEFWAKRMPETIWGHTSCEVMACIKIALKCVKSDEVMRPTITEIVDKLDINKIYTAEQLDYQTRKFTLNFLKGITNNFSTQNIVGRGGYGVVYKGVLDNGEEIAVKKIILEVPWIYKEEFKNEINNLTRAQHKNIVPLVGYCQHTEEILVPYEGKHVYAIVDHRALCLEYLQGGSLDKHLADDEACKLDWDTCYKIIKGICEGLHYLHNGSDSPIYHLDLKPQNILLDKYMIPKIGDFGLSRLFASRQTHKTQSDVKGTLGYMPREYIIGQVISPRFDIFSLGVIIIQMMAGEKGYDFDCADTSPEEFVKRVHGNWLKRLHATTVSNHASQSQEVMACIKIALRCVEIDRVQRPTITEILSELANIGTDESLLKATSEGDDQLEVLAANDAGHELQVTSKTPKELSILRAFDQRIQRSCRRMALKMSCTSSDIQDVALPAPAATVTSGAQRTALSSQRTLIHFDAGSSSHSNSRATTSTAARAHAAGALVDRGKGQQVEVIVDSMDEDPTFVANEIGTSQLRDTPPVSQPTPPQRRRDRDCTYVGSVNAPREP
ncbi:uncharacterized protein [Miscanthus floridulus]|uniref:uncharacterized protein isoform X2 n=1 Tax=Miscanthus floridulus TaxID=154761 RepID=UPI0034577EAB